MPTRSNQTMWLALPLRLFIFCFLSISLASQANTPGPDQNQQVKTGEVPKGLSSSDWLGIQTQIQLAENLSDHINVEAMGAGSPLIDLDFIEHNYLKASNTERADRFGWAVAMDGDTLAVSAIWEDSDAAGVDGDQSNNSARQSGAVYIFTLVGGQWSQQAYLKASNPGTEDYFGYAMALSGNTLAVGSTRERSSNGDPDDNSLVSPGAAYVFSRSGVIWTQQAYLKASNIGQLDEFGWSVALDGDTLVVGAHKEDGSATGVNGIANDSAADAGAAYVFVRSGEIWSQQAYLKASNTDAGDKFGHSVAISGNTIVVGVELEDSSATGVGGSEGNNSAVDAGAAYVFTRSGEIWAQQAYLKASNTDAADRFGVSVALETDTLLIGAYAEDGNGTDESNNSIPNAGAVYVFVRNGELWSQFAYLKASNLQRSDSFGKFLDISGNMLIVGAPGEASNATGVDGNQLNNSIPNAGAVYVFSLREASWSQKVYLKQFPSGQGQDGFSTALAISGDTVLVGANSENSNSTGVDGDQTNIFALEAGAAYVFKADLFFRDSFE